MHKLGICLYPLFDVMDWGNTQIHAIEIHCSELLHSE